MVRIMVRGIVVLAALVFAPPAVAATVQLGQTAPAGTPEAACGACSDFQAMTDSASASYAVPAGAETITSFSVLAPPASCSCTGTVRLRVMRLTTPNTYLVVGDSVDETVPDDGLVHTFTTSVAVRPGDLLGMRYTDIPSVWSNMHSDDVVDEILGDPTPGETTNDYEIVDNEHLNLAATLVTPAAAFSATPGTVTAGQAVAFDGSASTSGASITAYAWNFGDGQIVRATTPTISHTYTAAGNYTATLTITDADLNTATITHTVDVIPAFTGSTLAATTLPATKQGKVTLDLECSSTAVTTCADTVDLYTTAGTLPATASKKHKTATLKLLGRASYTIPSGGTAEETIKLDAAGRSMLHAHRKFSARILITATDAYDRTSTTPATVTVERHAPPKKLPRDTPPANLRVALSTIRLP